jgi:hypothetical protein
MRGESQCVVKTMKSDGFLVTFRTAINPLRCAVPATRKSRASIELRYPCFAQARSDHPWSLVQRYTLDPWTSARRIRLIELRSPCSAQALGELPLSPIERMRSTPGGSGQNFLRFRPRRFGSCLAAVQPTPARFAILLRSRTNRYCVTSHSCFVGSPASASRFASCSAHGPAATSYGGASNNVARPCTGVRRDAAHPYIGARL